jgi:hypothetical protein
VAALMMTQGAVAEGIMPPAAALPGLHLPLTLHLSPAQKDRCQPQRIDGNNVITKMMTMIIL